MKVSDLMNSRILTIKPETALCEVQELMLRFHLDDLIVVNDKNELEGIVTYSDIIRKVLPTQEELIRGEYMMPNMETFEERLLDMMDIPAKEIMTSKVRTVLPDTGIMEAGALMRAHCVTKLPVVDHKKVVGIITFTDIAWGLFSKSCMMGRKRLIHKALNKI